MTFEWNKRISCGVPTAVYPPHFSDPDRGMRNLLPERLRFLGRRLAIVNVMSLSIFKFGFLVTNFQFSETISWSGLWSGWYVWIKKHCFSADFSFGGLTSRSVSLLCSRAFIKALIE